MTTRDFAAALHAERRDLLAFCSTFDDAEWNAPSLASGWSVRDVVAHLGATCRGMFSPGALWALLSSNDLESTNEAPVRRRSSWSADRTLAEFATWSGRTVTLLRASRVPGVGAIRVPLGELGRYRVESFPAVFAFDWHTHVRYDIAEALGRAPAPSDDARMNLVVSWILQALEQMGSDSTAWLEDRLTLALEGPGGGRWSVQPAGDGRLRVSAEPGLTTPATIRGLTTDLPVWSTTRKSWRDCDIRLSGDTALAERLLDGIDIV
ncbi:hypothetical protein G4H71_13890 [Rhodococcus triatomae]|uniref:TIGR03083 family protein n=1 Tax=Rhodococcus triatomae TaxID=300028 RepID=A0A1G8PIT6_9NOCA|nr:maleylpyruvate isomerase N-terminal domain-containing protein [Rhodococcus triatomae]QNG20113.1 hypothetical protein G4H72_16485 [Rhodococcus triatomae]QNG23971.1 hypothetical protein G4H71_13890 [Rhodococcus triatomae]SDI92238.1 TIGR03083 family protein [Rhodococcus triatomae]